MTDYQTLIDRYIATWNETDPLARRPAVDGLWAEDGSYTDPIAVAEGRAAIDATIAAVQAQFPGLVLRLGGGGGRPRNPGPGRRAGRRPPQPGPVQLAPRPGRRRAHRDRVRRCGPGRRPDRERARLPRQG